MKKIGMFVGVILIIGLYSCNEKSVDYKIADPELSGKVEDLLAKMTLSEKIGQMSQVNGFGQELPADFIEKLKEGRIGSVLNMGSPELINEAQRIAIEESRLGIPLIVARDVIHGYKTIFPIPLGQGATWNPELVEKGARVAAEEATSDGIRWTFAPMLDITYDPRWGRIAESLGEDPILTSVLGAAMVRGFQGSDLSNTTSMAACAKHFAAYGAAEGGRDYNTVDMSETRLRQIYLPPFKAAADAGAATFMTAFNEISGIPASGNEFILRQVLKEEWKFKGFVVSDWNSIGEMVDHGFAADNKEAARISLGAGLDMEMANTTYADNAEVLVAEGKVSEADIDEAVRRILYIKFKLGLFENPYVEVKENSFYKAASLEMAKSAAIESFVLLKNENDILPLDFEKATIAMIGPLADAPADQLGTWSFDGEAAHSVTPLSAFKEKLGTRLLYAPGLDYSRDKSENGFAGALNVAKKSDVVLFMAGEEAILSGEAHSRADINLPGAQEELIKKLASTGKKIVLVIMAGRPITFENIVNEVDAVLFAWHPGTMAGEALAEVISGLQSPSGKLPVTFPRVVGQIPMYYAHKNTGRPSGPDYWTNINDIPLGAPQTSLGNRSHYLDYGYEPMYPFGYGLSYTTFEYSGLKLVKDKITTNEPLEVSVTLKNTGETDAKEVVQIYIRDMVASVTRPVKELKNFKKVFVKAGEELTLSFTLTKEDLSFFDNNPNFIVEPGKFKVFVGGSSQHVLEKDFEVVE